MTQHLADAGLRTLAYAAVFGQGLTYAQLSRFLLSQREYTKRSVSWLWKEWKRQGWLRPSTVPPQLPHWKKALTVRLLARWVPWVQSIWVTGSLAAGTAHKDDDIDFLVITDARRLWISRFFLVGLSVLLGFARTRSMREDRVRDRWCFNMWLEPDCVALLANIQNVYTAREVVQAVPLYVRSGVSAQDFVLKNRWAQKYFARGWSFAYKKAGGRNGSGLTSPQGESFRNRSPRRAVSPEPFRPYNLSDTLNDLAWEWQKRRISRGQTRELVEKKKAFFHPRDTRTSVTKEYERICTLLGLKPYA